MNRLFDGAVALLAGSILAAGIAIAATPTTRPARSAGATGAASKPSPSTRSAVSVTPGRRAAATQPSEDAKRIQSQLNGVRTLLDDPQGAAAALDSLKSIRADLLALDPGANASLFGETAYLWRLSQLLTSSNSEQYERVRRLAKSHPALFENLLFTLSPAFDHPVNAMALLDALCTRYPKFVDNYANLAVAICVVHDAYSGDLAKVTQAEPADPLDIFAFFIDNERRLAMSPRDLPPELLVYVVDVQCSIDEMRWAATHYHGQRNIGLRFFDVPYDLPAFLDGSRKEIERYNYTLPNLIKHGGICVDQAYFAAHVGKSLGVPSASVSGSGSDVGHAWTAFLETRGHEVRWNMESGRYDAYRGVRAATINPQTGEKISEGELSMLADMMSVSARNRLDAIVFSDIAGYEGMQHIDEPADKIDPRYQPKPDARKSPLNRRDDVFREDSARQEIGKMLPQQEVLLRAAIETNPACLPAWRQVGRLAPQFDARQRADWGGAIQALCGKKHADFAVKMFTPMIEAVEDPIERDRAWDAAGRLYGGNVDVAADILLAQAQLWYDQKDTQKAVRKCEAVMTNCSASGPRVLEAVKLADAILTESGQQNLLLRLYATAFERMTQPGEMDKAIVRTSAWYRVGRGYVQQLEDAGDTKTARKISRRLINMAGEDATQR